MGNKTLQEIITDINENQLSEKDNNNPPVIELNNINKWFVTNKSKVDVVREVNLVVNDKPEGEFIAILGPSGCGKSTLLNMLAGQIEPSTGTVKTFGKEIHYDNPDAVTVQQAYTCFDWRTVIENVMFGLEIQKTPKKERTEIAMHYLKKVGLSDRAHSYPKELSGGMKQRVAIARALAMKPRLILMDEPFGALDANIRAEMQNMLLDIWTEEKNTIVFITHDITEAAILADRIIVMSPRPTTIVSDIIVPFHRPRNEDITNSTKFVEFTQELLMLLKNQEGNGQVRVSL